jgi:hypothetical protein
MMWDRTAKDPDDPNREYKWNHFDVVRMESGLIREHWDEARIPTAPPGGSRSVRVRIENDVEPLNSQVVASLT